MFNCFVDFHRFYMPKINKAKVPKGEKKLSKIPTAADLKSFFLRRTTTIPSSNSQNSSIISTNEKIDTLIDLTS